MINKIQNSIKVFINELVFISELVQLLELDKTNIIVFINELVFKWIVQFRCYIIIIYRVGNIIMLQELKRL